MADDYDPPFTIPDIEDPFGYRATCRAMQGFEISDTRRVGRMSNVQEDTMDQAVAAERIKVEVSEATPTAQALGHVESSLDLVSSRVEKLRGRLAPALSHPGPTDAVNMSDKAGPDARSDLVKRIDVLELRGRALIHDLDDILDRLEL